VAGHLIWFLLGAVVGFDAVIAYAWLTLRRANRKVVNRVGLYTDLTRRW
jgi:hypothetical protein